MSSPADPTRTVPDERLWELRDLYLDRFPVPALSYGTVRDFADSLDNMAGLARAAPDMKNLQRPWAVKAVLGTVPSGGRVLEIGAGEPLVADVLSRLGYEVTVVDPYDGSGNGPHEYERFAREYPGLAFVRERFPAGVELAGELDCVLSVSVLEHIPPDEVAGVVQAAEAALRPGGISLHAIDHVLAGWGADEHLEGLRKATEAAGIPAGDLADLLARMAQDPETYLLSAEAHQAWRGSLPYDSYPMRRIASVHLAARNGETATFAAR